MQSERKYLTEAATDQALKFQDLTEKSSPDHAIRLLINEILSGLCDKGWPQATIHTGPRIVSAQDNYGLLGYDPAEITLGSEHTPLGRRRFVAAHTDNQPDSDSYPASCVYPAPRRDDSAGSTRDHFPTR